MKREHAYVVTWVQHGDFMSFTLRHQESPSYAVMLFVDVCLNYLDDFCYGDKLFDGVRLVARRAIYQGV